MKQIPTILTDSTTGSASSTLAAATNTTALTTTALEQVADGSLAEITFNSTWSQGQADTVDKNFKELTTQLALQRSLNTVLINAIASLAAKVNALVAAAR